MMLKCNNYIIGWTPKAGCTVTCKIWFEYMGELNYAMNKHEWIHNSRPYYYKKYGNVTNKHLISNKYIKIKYVRNPYTRAVSSYIHSMKTGIKKKYLNDSNMSFHTFLLNLKNNKFKPNYHYSYQITEFELNHNFDEVIKIEHLKRETTRLNKLYRLSLKNNFDSKHHVKKNHKETKFVGDTLFSEIKDIPEYKYFYNDEIRRLVKELYNLDIVKYNYKYPF